MNKRRRYKAKAKRAVARRIGNFRSRGGIVLDDPGRFATDAEARAAADHVFAKYDGLMQRLALHE